MRRLLESLANFWNTSSVSRLRVGYCWPTLPGRACSPLASVPPTSGVRPYVSGVWGGILDIIFVVENRCVGDETTPKILQGYRPKPSEGRFFGQAQSF